MSFSHQIKELGILCVIVSCFSSFLTAAEKAPSAETVGKLYVINVWGTDASDYKNFLDCMANQFSPTMWSSGLKPDSEFPGNSKPGSKINFCAEYITLLGKASFERENQSREKMNSSGIVKDFSNETIGIATNENVLEKCRYVSQKAGKNDVIFVYMCCHAKTAKLDGDNKRYHLLFPGIKDISEMKDNNNGIKRSDIIQALNPEKHRLVVLITDSSAREIDKPVQFPKSFGPSAIWTFHNNRLWLLLRTNVGLVDWNSASPFGGYDKQGELAAFYQPYSIFDQSFFYAFEEIDPDVKSISISEFFNGLKEKLALKFKYFKKNDKSEFGSEIIKTGCAAFDNQQTQTLFDFKGLGYAVDESDENNSDSYPASK
ncbi:MAG: hypothetical protein IJG38_00770 [Thermoguttaceae bacterium]|nr:hypothetical protein [Thermoguttaceae bacterium]MBQ6614941.1 hypothetical protein [Thermoguttaceae bacterium]